MSAPTASYPLSNVLANHRKPGGASSEISSPFPLSSNVDDVFVDIYYATGSESYTITFCVGKKPCYVSFPTKGALQLHNNKPEGGISTIFAIKLNEPLYNYLFELDLADKACKAPSKDVTVSSTIGSFTMLKQF